jgi:hypothetical protein
VTRAWTAPLLLAAAVTGCATPGVRLADGQQRYRCEHGIEFTVRFVDDTAMLDAGARGYDLLYRDAGGLTPQQSVFSNPRLRAEFGLGSGNNEALLRYPALPLVARCVRG